MSEQTSSTKTQGCAGLAKAVISGIMSAFLLGLLPWLPMNFFTSFLLVGAVYGIFAVSWTLLKHNETKARALAYLVSTVFTMLLSVPFFLILTSLDESPRDRSMYIPQLYDDCSRLRRLFECGEKPDVLSQLLSAIRCADSTMMWVPVRELKPRYIDLHQQCFGG